MAHFTDGIQAEGDLLPCADGIHSATRRTMDLNARYPALRRWSAGVLRLPGPRQRRDLVVRNPARPEEPSRAEIVGTSTEQWQQRRLELFADDPSRISEIIQATDSEIGAYTVDDLPTIPTWHHGPVTLVGDAAHATSPNAGQGASLAMEDALVVAKCLRDLPDPAQAFAAYE